MKEYVLTEAEAWIDLEDEAIPALIPTQNLLMLRN